MRPVGTARRGDVVFVQQIQMWERRSDLDSYAASIAALAQETGVTVAVLAPNLRPVGLMPLRMLRARRGPTPRWCRR